MSEFVRESILTYFNQNPKHSVSIHDLMRALAASRHQRVAYRKELRRLVKENVLTLDDNQKLRKALGQGGMIEGVVRRNAKGFGWLEVVGGERSDSAFLPPPEMDQLMDGDTVRARLTPSPKGPVGEIVEVVTRAHPTIVGTLRQDGRRWSVVVDATVLSQSIEIAQIPVLTPPAADGSVVEVTFERYPERHRAALGKITRVVGKEGELSTEIEVIISQASWVKEFSAKTLQETAPLHEDPQPSDWAGRLDVSKLALCTIDGETAKDFDDAVYAERRGKDIWVFVAIADVSHYVKEGTALDSDAFTRGTSLYYPGRCIPMLPEKISNGLCSLRPHVPRLCMAVEMMVSPTGKVRDVVLHEAVMRSAARLTYTQVQQHLDGQKVQLIDENSELQTSIHSLREAALSLRKARQGRGAIDFDLVESYIALDAKGEPVHIRPNERLEAHKLIEDLMVASNEAVATFLEEKGWPGIFRVHEPPSEDKLDAFLTMAQAVGAISPADHKAVKGSSAPKALSSIMKKLEKHSAKDALDTLLLRSMMQAKYSAENIGHYGLASESYLHFTSPIRRYPDLVVHRLVRAYLHGSKKKLSADQKAAMTDKLEQTAVHCSDRERKATDIERKIDALHACWLMRDSVGEEDEGVITSVAEFGFFVRLSKHWIEGMVHITALGAERYEFDPTRLRLAKKSGQSFSVGDKLRVRVRGVNISRRQIDLELASSPPQKAFVKPVGLPARREGRDFKPRKKRR